MAWQDNLKMLFCTAYEHVLYTVRLILQQSCREVTELWQPPVHDEWSYGAYGV